MRRLFHITAYVGLACVWLSPFGTSACGVTDTQIGLYDPGNEATSDACASDSFPSCDEETADVLVSNAWMTEAAAPGVSDGMVVEIDREAARAQDAVEEGTAVDGAEAPTAESGGQEASADTTVGCDCPASKISWYGFPNQSDGVSILEGCQTFTFQARWTPASCMQQIGCNGASVNAAVENVDVQKALAMQATYQSSAIAQQVTLIRVGTTAGLSFGPCPFGVSCPPVPAGVEGLVEFLVGIRVIQLGEPACAAVVAENLSAWEARQDGGAGEAASDAATDE